MPKYIIQFLIVNILFKQLTSYSSLVLSDYILSIYIYIYKYIYISTSTTEWDASSTRPQERPAPRDPSPGLSPCLQQTQIHAQQVYIQRKQSNSHEKCTPKNNII